MDRRDGVVTVTMNRPERKNAINATMLQALHDVLGRGRRPARDDRVLVSPAPAARSARAPTSAIRRGRPAARTTPPLVAMRRLGDAALALHRVVEADDRQGRRRGGRRRAEPGPWLRSGRRVGAGPVLGHLRPPGPVARLRRVVAAAPAVGLARAKELALFGDIIDAARAYDLGLVNRVVPVAELDAVRRRLGPSAGRRPAVGAVDDEDAAQRADVVVDVRGAGGRGRVARRSTSAPGTPRRRWPRSPRSGSRGSPAADPAAPAADPAALAARVHGGRAGRIVGVVARPRGVPGFWAVGLEREGRDVERRAGDGRRHRRRHQADQRQPPIPGRSGPVARTGWPSRSIRHNSSSRARRSSWRTSSEAS